MANFVFINDDFKFRDDYTTAFNFAIDRNDLIVSIEQPQKGQKGTHPFVIKNTFDPSHLFTFVKSEVFYIQTQDYAPNATFRFPWIATFDAPPVIITGSFSGTLEGVTGAFTATFDINVTRLTTSKRCAPIEDSTLNIGDKVCAVIDQADSENINNCIVVEDTVNEHDKTCAVVEQSLLLFDKKCGGQDDTEALIKKYDSILGQLTVFNDLKECSIVEETTPVNYKKCSIVQQMTKVYPDKYDIVIQDSSNTIHSFTFDYWDEIVPGDDYVPSFVFTPESKPDYDDGRTPKPAIEIIDYVFNGGDYTPSTLFDSFTQRLSAVVLPTMTILSQPDFKWNGVWGIYKDSDSYQRGGYRLSSLSSWDEALFTDLRQCVIVEEAKHPERGRTPWVDLPRPDPDPDPPSGSTYTVPRQEVYTVLNTILVTLDDDVTPIQLNNVDLNVDRDSSSWSFSADLIDPDEIDLVKQLPDGTAIKLHITINGYQWNVLVEKIQTKRVFGNKSIKISGRGLSALLSKPYEQPISVNIGTDTDIRVIVDNILPLGWNDQGDLYWLLGDDPIGSPVSWIVDGGAYSYQNKTPIEAIKGIADDIGVMLVPSRDSQEIYFKSCYPVLPWNFSGVLVDVSIPDDAIIELTEEPVSSFQANGVYVHGNEIGGELAFVRLNGTAGDRLAPTVNNSLMTDVVGLRSLGERILSGQYAQPKIKSITTFMDGTIVPLIELGDFVGFNVDAVETKGVANAVGINASFGNDGLSVSQSITIGESTPNTWVAFKEILPKDPMLVGTLSSTDGTTSLMVLLDGGVVRVRGTGTVTGKYYIRSGEIVSEAPNLTQSEIVL